MASASRPASAATSITDSFNTDTVTVNRDGVSTEYGFDARRLGGRDGDRALCIGDIATLGLTGALTVTTGQRGRQWHQHYDRLGGDLDHRERRWRYVTVTATALAQNTALTLVGSAAETVTGLVGDIAAGSLTGALTVTTGDAADNGISITTGSAATSITDSFNTDTVTVTATALAQNTALTLVGSAARGSDRTGRGYHGWFSDRRTDGDDRRCRRQWHSITTGSAATSITDSFTTDTVTVTATALAQNTAADAGSARRRRR